MLSRVKCGNRIVSTHPLFKSFCYILLLSEGHFRMNRQGKDGFAQTGGDVQITRYTGDMPVSFLMMHWYRIIDHGRDSLFFQQALKDIPPAIFYLDRILVIDMSRKYRSRRENQRIAGGQSFIVPRGNLPTGFRELLQMLQLHIQHSSLQRVQTGVASDPPMVVFAFLAMIGNHADTGSQRLVGSHQRPPIAIAG